MHNVPQLRDIREHFGPELVVIGVHSAKFSSEQLTANIRAAALRHGIQHPILNDAGLKTWSSYAVRAWPTLIVVDPEGRIAYETSGEILASELIPQLENLLEEYRQAGLIQPDTPPLGSLPPAGGSASLLSFPSNLALAGERLFIADTGHHRILETRLDAANSRAEVLRQFGCGEPGLQDGQASDARFSSPHGLSAAGQTLFVADRGNHAVRAIDLLSGQVETLAGTGEKGHGRLRHGPPTETPLRSPWDVLALGVDQPGQAPILFIAMAGSHQIWLRLEDGRLGVFAGSGQEALYDGPLAQAGFNQPSGLAFGMGHLFVADPEASAIRAISLGEQAQVYTLVGQGLFEFGDVDGEGSAVRLQHPGGLAYAAGQVYLADSYNHKIKILDPRTGAVRSLLGGAAGYADGAFADARLYEPEGLALQGDVLLIADTNNHQVRLADLRGGQLSTLELTGLENLAAPPADQPLRRLPPVSAAPGRFALRLDLQLPAGCHLNPEAPLSLALEGEAPQHFAPGQPLEISLEMSADRDLVFDIVVYYCQADELCLVHTSRASLLLRLEDGGLSALSLPYPVD